LEKKQEGRVRGGLVASKGGIYRSIQKKIERESGFLREKLHLERDRHDTL
jgi:hypothetical protein